MEKLLDIAEVAERSGVRASGLRYYEKKNLISSACRNGLRRQYEPGVLQELALILLAKSAGFSLDEIRSVVNGPQDAQIQRSTLREKADAVEQEAERMKVLARMLRHVADCQMDNHFDCPRFQKLLKIARKISKGSDQNSLPNR